MAVLKTGIENKLIKCVTESSFDGEKICFISNSKTSSNHVMYLYPDNKCGWFNLQVNNMRVWVKTKENFDKKNICLSFESSIILNILHHINDKLNLFLGEHFPNVSYVYYPCHTVVDKSGSNKNYDLPHSHENESFHVNTQKCCIMVGNKTYFFPQDIAILPHFNRAICNFVLTIKINTKDPTKIWCVPKIYTLEMCQETHSNNNIINDIHDCAKLQTKDISCIDIDDTKNVLYNGDKLTFVLENIYADMLNHFGKNYMLVNIQKNRLQKQRDILNNILKHVANILKQKHANLKHEIHLIDEFIKLNIFGTIINKSSRRFTLVCCMQYGIYGDNIYTWFSVLNYNENFVPYNRSVIASNTHKIIPQKIVVNV